MRPDDDMLDADLAWLDAELADAGAQARRGRAGRAQPTSTFSDRLRSDLMASLAGTAAASAPPAEETAAWAPIRLAPRVVARRTAPMPRARWALVAAAVISAVVVAGALGARLSWPTPSPVAESTPKPTEVAIAATTRPDAATDTPIVVVPPTGEPSGQPAATDSTTPKPSTEPTKTPGPNPTTHPEPTPTPAPTASPIGPMDLVATACPGGVVLDWTRPSTSTTHYRTLRGAGPEAPSTYPADSGTDVGTAATSSGGATDGFDSTLDGGATPAYRVFAFDADNHLLRFSPSQQVTTIGRLDLGTPTIENLGTGKFRVGWSTGDVTASCFSSGRLVVSDSDPDPSWSKGSYQVALISDRLATSNVVDSLPTGGTYWVRYEILRTTGTGSFIVARTSAIQVTVP